MRDRDLVDVFGLLRQRRDRACGDVRIGHRDFGGRSFRVTSAGDDGRFGLHRGRGFDGLGWARRRYFGRYPLDRSRGRGGGDRFRRRGRGRGLRDRRCRRRRDGLGRLDDRRRGRRRGRGEARLDRLFVVAERRAVRRRERCAVGRRELRAVGRRRRRRFGQRRRQGRERRRELDLGGAALLRDVLEDVRGARRDPGHREGQAGRAHGEGRGRADPDGRRRDRERSAAVPAEVEVGVDQGPGRKRRVDDRAVADDDLDAGVDVLEDEPGLRPQDRAAVDVQQRHVVDQRRARQVGGMGRKLAAQDEPARGAVAGVAHAQPDV